MSTLEIGASNAGAFVKTLVNHETGETGFQEGFHVHKSWFRKCKTYDEVMESIAKSEADREDQLVELKNIHPVVNQDGKFAFEVGSEQYVPTDWALSQFSSRLNLPSSTVIRELVNRPDSDWEDADVAVRIAKNAIRRGDADKKYRLRTYKDGTLRAWVTDKYAPVDNRWYMETLKDILPGSMYSHWRGSDDTIYGNVLLPDSIIDYGQDDDSDYGGMLSISNCEIGRRRLGQRPSIFRSICMNGCIWDQVKGEMINQRHIGQIDLVELRKRMVDNIELQLKLVPEAVRKFISTRDLKVEGSLKATLAAVCIKNRVERKHSQEILEQFVTFEKDHRSLFGVINAITRAGQKFNDEEWVKFDELGGKLAGYDDGEWGSVTRYAATLGVKEVDEAFMAGVAG
jgi:hypothetical protein